jgi:hypothetical protein
MILLFFVFSVGAVAVSFFSYRIFKAMAMGQLGGGFGGPGMMSGALNVPNRDTYNDTDPDEERRAGGARDNN